MTDTAPPIEAYERSAPSTEHRNGRVPGARGADELRAVERQLLSTVIRRADDLDPALVGRAAATTYTGPAHQVIATAIGQLVETGLPVDLHTLTRNLMTAGPTVREALQDLATDPALVGVRERVPEWLDLVDAYTADLELGRQITAARELIDEGSAAAAAQLLDAALERHRTGRGTHSRLRSELLAGNEILTIPQPTYVLDRLFVDDALTSLYGGSGAGKTFVALGGSLSVATGRPFAGLDVLRPGPVIYGCAEDAAGIRLRYETWCRWQGVDDVPNIHFLPGSAAIGDPAWTADMAAAVAEIEPALVVIDTLAKSLDLELDENVARDANRALHSMETIQRAAHCAVLYVHHTGKDPTKAERGSSALRAGTATALEVIDHGNGRLQVITRKAKNAPTGDSLRLRLKSAGDSCIVTADDRDPAEHLHPTALEALATLAAAGRPLTMKAWEESGSMSRTVLFERRNELEAAGAIVRDATGPSGIRFTPSDLGFSVLGSDSPEGVRP